MSIWDKATKYSLEMAKEALVDSISPAEEPRQTSGIVTPSHMNPVEEAPAKEKKFHEGKKSHALSAVMVLVGVASVTGFLPSIPPPDGIDLLKGSGILSGVRLLMDAPLRLVERFIRRK